MRCAVELMCSITTPGWECVIFVTCGTVILSCVTALGWYGAEQEENSDGH